MPDSQRLSAIHPQWESLSPRQKQVLLAILDGGGLKQNQIAFEIGMHLKTLAAHKAAAFRKLSLKNDIELVRFAIRNGVIEA